MINKLASLAKFLQENSYSEADSVLKLAEESDAKYIKSINIGELSKQKSPEPGQNPKEFYKTLQGEADSGPIFSSTTLDFIRRLPANVLPQENRKTFVKWLANRLENEVPNGFIANDEIRYLKDWYNAIQPNLEGLSYAEAYEEAERWHVSLWEPEEPIDFSDKPKIEAGADEGTVVYTFENGFKILKLTAGACSLEGKQMGHCVGTYAKNVERGEVEIYSLRDPTNRPHVTFEVDPETREVNQIKGKQNQPPIEKYVPMVKEWLASTNFKYISSPDYINMIPFEEVLSMWHENKKHASLSTELSRNTKTPPEILDELSKDEDYLIRANVARHPNVSESTALKLVNDEDWYVILNIVSSKFPSVLAQAYDRIKKEADSGGLSVDSEVLMMQNLAQNHNLPDETIVDMFTNFRYVRSTLLESTRRIPEEVISLALKSLRTEPDQFRKNILARLLSQRREATVEVLGEIINQVNDDDIVENVIAHDKITPDLLLKIINDQNKYYNKKKARRRYKELTGAYPKDQPLYYDEEEYSEVST